MAIKRLALLLTLAIAASIVFVAFRFLDNQRNAAQTTTGKSKAANLVAPAVTPCRGCSSSVTPFPKFIIYKQGSAYPISVVVEEHTTDEQVRSLLWFFRRKVRSHDFKSIGLTRPTSVNFGKENWNSGMIVIFRGTICAGENDAIQGLGPCGKGDHSAGTYQWGIDGRFDKDAGTVGPVSNENGTLVFDYTDGWFPHPNVQGRPETKEDKREILEEASERDKKVFADLLQEKVNSHGFADMNIWPISGKELELNSELFEHNSGRVKFLSRVLPAWRKDLCPVGFKNVRLAYGMFPLSGNTYSIGCH